MFGARRNNDIGVNAKSKKHFNISASDFHWIIRKEIKLNETILKEKKEKENKK